MDRRKLLKLLSATPLLSLSAPFGCSGKSESAKLESTKPGAAPPKPSPEPNGRLNVVLHGMFAIGLDIKNPANKKAWLCAPNVQDHIYAAAAANIDNANNVNWIWQKRIGPTTSSSLIIPNRSSAAGSIPGNLELKIDWKKSKIDHVSPSGKNPPYWSVALPMPDEIWPMRSYSGNIFDPSGKTFRDNGLSVSGVPTVYALTYGAIGLANVPTFDSVPIKFSAVDNVARLHLFAASPFPPMDANMAINQFNKMFEDAANNPALDLSVQNGLGGTAVKIDGGFQSVVPCEERHLGELEVDCSTITAVTGSTGTRPTNCMSLAVTVTP